MRSNRVQGEPPSSLGADQRYHRHRQPKNVRRCVAQPRATTKRGAASHTKRPNLLSLICESVVLAHASEPSLTHRIQPMILCLFIGPA